MPLLSAFTAIVKQALGVPKLLTLGVKRSTARMLTFGLKRMGFNVEYIKRQAVEMFEAPSPRAVSRVIEAASQRMDLLEQINMFTDDAAFPRSMMFETSFRKDRNFRYFMNVNLFNRDTKMRETRWVSFYGDENMSKDQLASWYEKNMLDEFYKGQYGFLSYNVYEVWHNKGNRYTAG